MTAAAPDFAGQLRADWGMRQWMSEHFGVIRTERRRGRAPTHYVEVWVDGTCHRLRHVPTPDGPIPIRGERWLAEKLLGWIRARRADGKTPLQAVSPYLSKSAHERTFSYAYARFLAAKRTQHEHGSRQLSAQRLSELEGHLRRGHLDPLINIPVDDLKVGTLEDWRGWLFGLGLAPKTVHNVIADVGACLRWLERREELPRVPQMPAVHVPDYAPKIPSEGQQRALLEAIPWPLRGVFLARGYMGLRPSEARRANVADYDYDAGTLSVVGKGGRLRVLPVDADVAAWVLEFVSPADRLQGAVPLFANPAATGRERRWTKAATRRVWLAACRECGVHFRENESLRHAFATHAINRGVGRDVLMLMMGHTQVHTSNRYAKLGARAREVRAALPPKGVR